MSLCAISDDDGASCNESVTITVGAANTPPTCNIDSPSVDTTINVGDPINYTGTATDSDGTIASYSWTFQGGSIGSAVVEDPGIVSYSSAGTFTSSFTATDDAGASCEADTVIITVQGTVLACSDHNNRRDCKNDSNCSWNSKNKTCGNK